MHKVIENHGWDSNVRKLCMQLAGALACDKGDLMSKAQVFTLLKQAMALLIRHGQGEWFFTNCGQRPHLHPNLECPSKCTEEDCEVDAAAWISAAAYDMPTAVHMLATRNSQALLHTNTPVSAFTTSHTLLLHPRLTCMNHTQQQLPSLYGTMQMQRAGQASLQWTNADGIVVTSFTPFVEEEVAAAEQAFLQGQDMATALKLLLTRVPLQPRASNPASNPAAVTGLNTTVASPGTPSTVVKPLTVKNAGVAKSKVITTASATAKPTTTTTTHDNAMRQ
jgi:hypothetical protein